MGSREALAWQAFFDVARIFLGSNRPKKYVKIVKNLIAWFQGFGANRHLDRSQENMGSVSDEQGVRFHQDIK